MAEGSCETDAPLKGMAGVGAAGSGRGRWFQISLWRRHSWELGSVCVRVGESKGKY